MFFVIFEYTFVIFYGPRPSAPIGRLVGPFVPRLLRPPPIGLHVGLPIGVPFPSADENDALGFDTITKKQSKNLNTI